MTDELAALPGKKFILTIGFIFVTVGIIVLVYDLDAFGLNVPSPAAAAVSLWQQATTTWHDIAISINPPRRDGGLSKSSVADLQARLAQSTAIYPEGIVSGIYGDLTTKAIMRFQEKYGLSVTGMADAETVKKIKEVFAAPAKTASYAAAAASPSAGGGSNTPPPSPKPHVDAIIVRDQFGHGVSNARIWFEDREARRYPAGSWSNYWTTDDNGRIELYYNAKTTSSSVPDGEFTAHIEKTGYTSTEVHIQFKSDASTRSLWVTPNTFTLSKQGIIAFVLVDEFGEPLHGYFTLNDAQGREIDRGSTIDTGRGETRLVADGQYNLRIQTTLYIAGIYADGDTTYQSIERTVTMTGGVDMFLGKIVLTKK